MTAPVTHQWQTQPAVRANVGMFIGIAGPTGSGKTWSALELATGLTPPGERLVVIDTEHERARFYADDFPFDHCPFDPPFSSERYGSVIEHHLSKGYKVIVVDSASHEYIGEGGMHDEHDRILDEMVERSKRSGAEWQIRAALTWPAWREPKRAHKRFKAQLTRLPPGHHIIMCFRAERKTEMATVKEHGQEQKVVRPKEGPTGRDGWFPLCDEALPYEMTLSFLVLADKPGVPLPIKAIPSRLRSFFPLDKPLNRESGRQLAEWAKGGSVGSGDAKSNASSHSAVAPRPAADSGQLPSGSVADERKRLLDEIRDEAKRRQIPTADLNAAWPTYLGTATKDNADPAALTDLLSWVRTRGPQSPPPPGRAT